MDGTVLDLKKHTIRTEINGIDRSLTKNTRNRTERGWNDWDKNEEERNNLAGGPCFRTVRKN